jgi:biopolymer transport protein ExbD
MCFGPVRPRSVAVVLALLGAPDFGRADGPPLERPGRAPAVFRDIVVHLDGGGVVRVDGVRTKREEVRDHVTRYLRATTGKGTVTVHCRADVPFGEVFQLLEELRAVGAPHSTRLSVRE